MSNAKYIQESYTAITPYLNSKLDLIDFLKNAFGADVRRLGKFSRRGENPRQHLVDSQPTKARSE
jgi:hypothetical protein